MNTEMRRQLARQPFEQKMRKVAELIRLARKLKADRVREGLARLSGIRIAQSEMR
jgi:hypothetical protein